MNRTFTLICHAMACALLLLCAPKPLQAQVFNTIELGGYYTGLAKDASNNIYVTRYNFSNNYYEVAKYTNGTGTPTVIYSGLAFNSIQYPWGLAVAGNGDVYISTYVENKVIKLIYNGGNSYTASDFLVGTATAGYYGAVAFDAGNNLYTTEYNGTNYAVVKYAPGSTAGMPLYSALYSDSSSQTPTGLAVAPNGDVYVTDGFYSTANQNGHLYKLTAATNYTLSTVSSGKFSTSVAVDPMGNVYCAEYNGSTYVLNKYYNGTGSPTVLSTLLSAFYPWGIAVLNSQNIYFSTGSDASMQGGALQQLLDVPQVEASNIAFTNITTTGATATWTRGSGTSCVVFIAQASTGSPAPVTNTTYTANANFASGSQIGASGWYCVYSGTGTSVNITGLTAGTTYRAMVIEVNGAAGDEHYNPTISSNINNFITDVPLPVALTSFDAQYRDGKVYLSWETQQEINNKQFRIQWSGKGNDSWKEIGAVASKADQGTSKSPLSYSFVYDKPQPGLNLFRLLQEDLDGKTALSNTAQVMVAATTDLQLSPNPVKNMLAITATNLSGADIFVMNATGRIVLQQKATGTIANINFSSLTAGIYWVKIVQGTTASIHKIVKQ